LRASSVLLHVSVASSLHGCVLFEVMLQPPPVTRNLTFLFGSIREQRRSARRAGYGEEEATEDYLLATDGGVRMFTAVEMTAPVATARPQWTEAAQEATADLKSIREKLVLLAKAQQRRLIKVFVDDGAPDKDVEAISNQISSLARRCEQHIHHIKTRAANGEATTQKEQQCRDNVQKNLATQLQQLSQQFRASQKEYLGEIRKRNKGAVWDDPPAEDDGRDTGFTDAQMQDLEAMEINAGRRSEEITQIATSVNELHTVFKELAVFVIDQGTILDRIDYNIESVVVQSVEANRQLKKAEDTQKSNRAMKCIIILVIINLCLILVLIVRARH